MSPVAVSGERAGLGLALGPVGVATGHSRHDGVKAVCDRVEDLKAVGELLSD